MVGAKQKTILEEKQAIAETSRFQSS